jgi:hypothetical protein
MDLLIKFPFSQFNAYRIKYKKQLISPPIKVFSSLFSPPPSLKKKKEKRKKERKKKKE